MYVPYLKQEEPLKVECQHFLDCIANDCAPLTDGHAGLDLVRILEAASKSLDQKGAAIDLVKHQADHLTQRRLKLHQTAPPAASQPPEGGRIGARR